MAFGASGALALLFFQALKIEACPDDCRKPSCANGAPFNGGLPLTGDVCLHICSHKFGETRYCGASEKYKEGDSIDCTSCAQAPAMVPGVNAPLRVRESILKEARERLTAWYGRKDELTLPYWEYKAKVQQTKHWYFCDQGGDTKVPVTFGEFNVSDVRPAQLFDVLADLEGQLKWDTAMTEAKIIKSFPQDGVVGAEVIYPSTIWLVPPRQIFEWVAFNASVADQEYWFAVSSLHVEKLKEEEKPDKYAVQAENCLGAYWIRACPAGGEKSCPSGNPSDCCPEGGSRIQFTTHVNLHPPSFLNAKTIFDLGWTKQIDWIMSLKKRAEEKQNTTMRGSEAPTLPKWLWQDPKGPVQGHVRFLFPQAMVPSKLFERHDLDAKLHLNAPLLVALAALLGVLALVVGARCKEPRHESRLLVKELIHRDVELE